VWAESFEMEVAVLITGGKDSTLALHRVLEQGHKVKVLVAMLPKREDSWMFHYPNIHLVDLFSEAVGIPLVKAETEGVKEVEVEDLKRLLSTLNVQGVVSGAVASKYQKSRIDRVCKELGMISIAPLWGEKPKKILREIISLKFKVAIVGVYAYGFDESWLGKLIDESVLKDLLRLEQKFEISPVGEGGEYETLVLDAPFFKKKIQLVEVEKIWKDSYGYLAVKKAKLVSK